MSADTEATVECWIDGRMQSVPATEANKRQAAHDARIAAMVTDEMNRTSRGRRSNDCRMDALEAAMDVLTRRIEQLETSHE